MTGSELLDSLELVDPAYVEAADTFPAKRGAVWIKWAAAAAACAVVLLGGYFAVRYMANTPESVGYIDPANPTVLKFNEARESGGEGDPQPPPLTETLSDDEMQAMLPAGGKWQAVSGSASVQYRRTSTPETTAYGIGLVNSAGRKIHVGFSMNTTGEDYYSGELDGCIPVYPDSVAENYVGDVRVLAYVYNHDSYDSGTSDLRAYFTVGGVNYNLVTFFVPENELKTAMAEITEVVLGYLDRKTPIDMSIHLIPYEWFFEDRISLEKAREEPLLGKYAISELPEGEKYAGFRSYYWLETYGEEQDCELYLLNGLWVVTPQKTADLENSGVPLGEITEEVLKSHVSKREGWEYDGEIPSFIWASHDFLSITVLFEDAKVTIEMTDPQLDWVYSQLMAIKGR